MQDVSGVRARGSRSRRFHRGEEAFGSGEDQRSRLGELERERAALEMFARMAAHELEAPLIATEARARMIMERLDDGVEGDTRGELSELLRTLSRMRLLVDTLLEEARCTGESLKRSVVSLQRVVDDSVSSLHGEIRARHARVIANDLPVVRGHGLLLSVVIRNLVLNALRYGPRAGGTVRIEGHHEGPHWKISVTSLGATLSSEDRARIFVPYQRGTRERRGSGVGLGLTICRSIVERHGGVIGVAPLSDGGNRFYFTIPAESNLLMEATARALS